MNVKKDGFYVQGHFPGQPVMPGVLIVEAFGQAAAALTAHGINPKEYENKFLGFANPNSFSMLGLPSLPNSVSEVRELSIASQNFETDFILTDFDASKKNYDKVEEYCGLPTKNVEPIQLVRYEPGQYFKPHYDYLDRKIYHHLNEYDSVQRIQFQIYQRMT